MNLTLETGVSAITVFLQGLISFFSPCVLPLIPLYIGYLSGGTKTVDKEGNIYYKRNKVMLNTLFLYSASASPFSCWDWDLLH